MWDRNIHNSVRRIRRGAEKQTYRTMKHCYLCPPAECPVWPPAWRASRWRAAAPGGGNSPQWSQSPGLRMSSWCYDGGASLCHRYGCGLHCRTKVQLWRWIKSDTWKRLRGPVMTEAQDMWSLSQWLRPLITAQPLYSFFSPPITLGLVRCVLSWSSQLGWVWPQIMNILGLPMLCAINYRDPEYYGLYLQPQTFKSLKLEKKLKKKLIL